MPEPQMVGPNDYDELIIRPCLPGPLSGMFWVQQICHFSDGDQGGIQTFATREEAEQLAEAVAEAASQMGRPFQVQWLDEPLAD